MSNEPKVDLAGVDELVGRLRQPNECERWLFSVPFEAADMLQSLIATAREAEALRAENARLREALRVYAGPMEWTQEGGWGAFPVWADGYPGGVYVDDNTLDYGDAARAALKGSQQ